MALAASDVDLLDRAAALLDKEAHSTKNTYNIKGKTNTLQGGFNILVDLKIPMFNCDG